MPLLNLLREVFAPAADAAEVDADRRLHLAAAVLLFEVARADHNVGDEEIDRLREILRSHWSLADADVADLLDAARDQAEASASLHAQVDLLNSEFDRERKLSLLTGLWQVAGADGEIHHYEEHLVRRLADLLHLKHADFIRCKHRALGTA